ncbi:hypothetical protein HK104_000753, partial [Borealophlyctis nickersoniae]
MPTEDQYQKFAENDKCFFDLIYLHDKASPLNAVQAIFDTCTAMQSEEKRERYFEVTRSTKR